MLTLLAEQLERKVWFIKGVNNVSSKQFRIPHVCLFGCLMLPFFVGWFVSRIT